MKDLLQNNLEKYKQLVNEHEQGKDIPQTPAVVEFSVLVIFCVEVTKALISAFY